MSILVCILTLFWNADDETYTVTLTFQSMHCDSCKEELQANLESLKGVTSVRLGDKSAVVLVEESTKFELGKLKPCAPRDMKLAAVLLKIRGIVGADLKLTAKGSGMVFALADPPKKKILDELKKALGGENQFWIEGAAVESAKIELSGFEKTAWKD